MEGVDSPNEESSNPRDRFSFARKMDSLKEDGFRWEDFREIFLFGFLDIREGEYVQLVYAVLDSLPHDKEQALLLDLLNAHWCVYVEQLWIPHECGGDPQRFAGENHFALARLQIGCNIRFERGLPEKDGRRAIWRNSTR